MRSKYIISSNSSFSYFPINLENKPKIVIVAAARVGGIIANIKFKNKFIYENLQIQNNLIHGSYLAGCKNLILLGNVEIISKANELFLINKGA